PLPLLDGPMRLRQAIRQVQEQLSATTAKLRQSGAGKQAGILDAQRLILDDPAFVDAVVASMARGMLADQAVQSALEPYVAMLVASPDPVFQARAADLRDVIHQVQKALQGRPGTLPN